MEFVIRKNATLPLLKMQVVKDGRGSYEDFMRFIETSTIYFSMQNVSTGAVKINSAFGGFVEKEFIEPNATPEYYLYYRFTKKDTNKPGRYEGQFMLKNDLGTLILPIREKLNILIEESLLEDDIDYNECYVHEFKCCILQPTPSVTPTNTITPSITPTNTVTPTYTPSQTVTPSFTPSVTPTSTLQPTPTPTPSATPQSYPPNDFYYLIIPDNDFNYQYLFPSPFINDFNYEIIPNNDLYFEYLTPNPIIYDLTYEIIPNNDTTYELINLIPIIDDFTFDVIPNNDFTFDYFNNSVIFSFEYLIIPNNDLESQILQNNCTGATYTLIRLPYEPPAPGKTIFPGFTEGFGTGTTNPNNFDLDAVYWAQVDNKGIDRTDYFSGITNEVIISFSQNGNTTIYSAETNSFGFVPGGFFYHDKLSFPEMGTMTLLESSPVNFTEGQEVCISYEVIITPPPIVVPRILYYNTNNLNSYSGTSVIYDLENNSNGDLFNSPISGDTGCGTDLNFDGINQYIITQTDLTNQFSGASPTISTLTSIFMWIYPTGNGVILTELGQAAVGGGGWHDVQIEMVSGVLKFGMWNGSSISPITSSIPTPFNNWYYIGMVYDGVSLTAYVGGSQAGQTYFTRQAPYNNGGGLYYGIGAADFTNMGDGNYGNFKIGALEIYNGALTALDVYNNYISGQTEWICPTPTPTPTSTPTPTPTPSSTVLPNYWQLSNCNIGVNIVVDFVGYTPTEGKTYNITFTNYTPPNNNNCWLVGAQSMDIPYTTVSTINSGPFDDCPSCPI